MSLFSGIGFVSSRKMYRMLCAVLIVILLSSHGTMGVAAPHHDGESHSHVGQHSHDVGSQAADDDHHDAGDDAASTAMADSEASANSGADDAVTDAGASTGHAHASADRVPASFAIPERLPSGSQLETLLVTRLASAGHSPLLEPPSA